MTDTIVRAAAVYLLAWIAIPSQDNPVLTGSAKWLAETCMFLAVLVAMWLFTHRNSQVANYSRIAGAVLAVILLAVLVWTIWEDV